MGLGEHRFARSRAFAWCVHRFARSCAWARVAHRFARASGLYASSPHQRTPPLLRKTCTRASRIAVFRPDFDARVHVLGEALCGFESLARCRKNPSRVTGTGCERLWRRERDSNPRDAHAPNGFQDRRIQPLCHLSVVGNDSIEYRPA